MWSIVDYVIDKWQCFTQSEVVPFLSYVMTPFHNLIITCMKKGFGKDWTFLKLILEFNGLASVIQWVEKAYLGCNLYGVKQVEQVFSLTGEIFAISNANQIMDAVFMEFAMDPALWGYEQLMACNLCLGEMVDIYLEEWRKLVVLFERIFDYRLACPFVAGLQGYMNWLLHMFSMVSALPVNQLLAQTIMKDMLAMEELVMIAVQQSLNIHETACYKCNDPDHFVRDCLSRGKCAHCYHCNNT